MTRYLSNDVQRKMIKHLPVKSVMRWTSTSKDMNAWIKSSEFISEYTRLRKTKNRHMLIIKIDPFDEVVYVSYIDDDDFPGVSDIPEIPPAISPLNLKKIIGSSFGLLGLHDCQTFFFWNPSIRRTFSLTVPADAYMTFGVCAQTFDPKLLTYSDVPNAARIYSIHTREWRDIAVVLPFEKTYVDWCHSVVTDGYSYWLVRLPNERKIVSFNFSTESFETMDFPDGLVLGSHYRISEVTGSLAIIQMVGHIYNVWILDVSVGRDFRHLFTFDTSHELKTCTKNANLIMVRADDEDDEYYELVYQVPPNLQEHIVMEMADSSFSVHSYVEGLLLLDQEGCVTY